MTFTNPLLLTALLIVPILLRFQRTRPHTGAFALHCAVLACLIIALAGPVIQLSSISEKIVHCVDVSPSIPDSEKNGLYSYLSHSTQPIIIFDNDSQRIQRRITAKNLTASQASSTRALPALQKAYALLAPYGGGEIVLFTDGNLTDQDDVLEYVRFLRSQQCIVHVYPTGTSIGHDVIAGEPQPLQSYSIAVPIQQAGTATDVSVTLKSGDTLLDEVQVAASHQTVATLQGSKPRQPVEVWQIDIRSTNEEYTDRNNTVYYDVVQEDTKRILRIADTPQSGVLAAALKGSFEIVDACTSQLRDRYIPLARTFDVILLDDIPAYKLTPSQQAKIYLAVHDTGAGLIMCGLNGAFATGGYTDTDIARLLPVTMAPQQPRADQDFFVLLDTSGSMDTRSDRDPSHLEGAINAAIQLVENLNDTDRFAVIAFDIEPRVTVPLTQAAFLTDLRATLDKLSPAGGTDIASVLKTAYETTSQNTERSGHIILVSDGQTKDRRQCIEFAGLIASQNKTLTVIGIGQAADVSFLEQLASAGGGRAYHIDNTSVLPTIFLREKALTTGEFISRQPAEIQFAKEPGMYNRLHASGSSATVASYTRVSARDKADVACTTRDGSPLIAYHHAGLATTAIWASTIEARWMDRWERGFYPQLMRPLFTLTAKQTVEQESEPISVQIKGNRVVVSGQIDAVSIEVTGPDGHARTITPVPTAGGFYAVFSFDRAGIYAIRVEDSSSQSYPTLFRASYSAEYKLFTPDWNFIATVLRVSSGKSFQSITDLKYHSPGQHTKKKKPVRALFVILALVLFLPELILRKNIRPRYVYRRIQQEGFRSLFKEINRT